MVRLVEVFQLGDYFYQQVGLAKAHIMMIMCAYQKAPDELKSKLQKAYDLLDEAKEYMDGCDVTVVQAKK